MESGNSEIDIARQAAKHSPAQSRKLSLIWKPLIVLAVIWGATWSSFIYVLVSEQWFDYDSLWRFSVYFLFGLAYAAPFWMAAVVSLFDLRLWIRGLFFVAMLFTPLLSFAAFKLWCKFSYEFQYAAPDWRDICEVNVAVPMIALATSMPLLVLRFQFGRVVSFTDSTIRYLKPLSILTLMIFAVIVSGCVAITFFIYEADNDRYWATVIFASAFCSILSAVAITWLIPVLGQRIRWIWIVANSMAAVLLAGVVFPLFVYLTYGNSGSDETVSICLFLFAGYCWVMLFLFLFRFSGMRLVKFETRRPGSENGPVNEPAIDPLAPDEFDE